MAFTTMDLTWNTVAKVLPRISTSENRGDYAIDGLTEGNLRATISHLYNKRTRRTVRLDLSANAADPLLTGVYTPISMSVYVVADVPKGATFTPAQQKIVVTALADWLKAGTNTDKFLAGEN